MRARSVDKAWRLGVVQTCSLLKILIFSLLRKPLCPIFSMPWKPAGAAGSRFAPSLELAALRRRKGDQDEADHNRHDGGHEPDGVECM